MLLETKRLVRNVLIAAGVSSLLGLSCQSSETYACVLTCVCTRMCKHLRGYPSVSILN